MKKKWLSVVLVLVLLVLSGMPVAGSTPYLLCVPGAYEASTYYPAQIEVGPNQYLIGKFYYPDPGPSGPGFAPNSLPGVLLTHGFGETYADVEADAAALARNCMVALTFNYFGQGWDGDHRA
ncbi:MAG: hypothetical protein HY784_17195 [Chloroflexi bacterium]|nr:hypothetical protein [Chloroflexota bacterium]